MILENKVAVIYGAGGSIGGAVARAFAREGAHVALTGRTKEKLERVAHEIRMKGGVAEVAIVDALDETAINSYVDSVVKQTGQIDISFNAISYGDVQKPLMEISLNDFEQPIRIATRTQFLTTRAAARHMIKRGSGVILMFGGTGDTPPGLGGFLPALDAVEKLRRQWAVELGEHGIRAVTLQTGGILESIAPDMEGRDEIVQAITEATLLKRAATLADVGNVAAFVASEQGHCLTGTQVNITCGAVLD